MYGQSFRRRGIIAVQVAVSLIVIMGFAMLSVDVGVLYNSKTDLQRAADAAAMSGASAYLTDAALANNESLLISLLHSRSQQYSALNPTLRESTQLELSDILFGTHEYGHPETALAMNGTRWNGLEVTVRRQSESVNGAVPLFFARVFGHERADVTATARAAVDDRVAGYRFVEDGGFLPFTIHEDLYNDLVANGPDNFSYDDSVIRIGDNINEIRLFPWKWSDEDKALNNGQTLQDGNDASGNFGTLNIGIGNQGTITLENQILNGIDAADMENEFGTSDLIFYDPIKGQQTYQATGNPGLSTAVKDELDVRIGDVVGFFLHNDSYDNGSGATFVVTAIRFGRVMDVKLTGNPNDRSLVLQPVAYTDGYVIIDESAPSTGGQLGRIVLVK